jgi:hypothetical protein
MPRPQSDAEVTELVHASCRPQETLRLGRATYDS